MLKGDGIVDLESGNDVDDLRFVGRNGHVSYRTSDANVGWMAHSEEIRAGVKGFKDDCTWKRTQI